MQVSRSRRGVVLGMLASVALVCVVSSCKSTPKVPPAGPMPVGGKVSGVWFSQQFEQMYLRQVGDEVRGIYTYKYGGTIEGKITGDLIKFKWIDPGDPREARRTLQGEGYWQIVREGEQVFLRGRWGYNEDYYEGGPWEAEWVRDVEADDPKNIEEFRKGSVR